MFLSTGKAMAKITPFRIIKDFSYHKKPFYRKSVFVSLTLCLVNLTFVQNLETAGLQTHKPMIMRFII